VTAAERRAALEEIAAEVRDCTRCRLHETRTKAVPGEGDADTEVFFVGEGPGFNEDREGRPFVGRAGGLLERLLASLGWTRDDVFITNVVKCRPPDNRDPEPDEMAACAPFLRRQLEVLDPSVVVTLGRFSMGTFMPGVRITQAHGTTRLADPATGARDATVFAMYHPAYALRNPAVERESFEDMSHIPDVLVAARERRRQAATSQSPAPARLDEASTPATTDSAPAPAATDSAPTPATTDAALTEPTAPAAAGPSPAAAPGPSSTTADQATERPAPTTPDADQLSLF
jgi:DNA polymerase